MITRCEGHISTTWAINQRYPFIHRCTRLLSEGSAMVVKEYEYASAGVELIGPICLKGSFVQLCLNDIMKD